MAVLQSYRAIALTTLLSLLLPATNTAFHIPKLSTTSKLSSALYAENENKKKKVVVIGNGMVGQRFMENMLKEAGDDVQLATFCEEPRAAYNRVKLTSYFETREPSALTMTSEFDKDGRTAWYEDIFRVEFDTTEKAW